MADPQNIQSLNIRSALAAIFDFGIRAVPTIGQIRWLLHRYQDWAEQVCRPEITVVAFITRGEAGMGLAAVKAFAEEGAAVAVVDNNEAAANAVTEHLMHAGHRAAAIRQHHRRSAQPPAWS